MLPPLWLCRIHEVALLQLRHKSVKVELLSAWQTVVSLMNFIFRWPCILVWFMVNDHLDAQFFSMYLFQLSSFFEQPRAHHQENQLYQYNLWYMSVCVGDRFVCRSERNFPTCTRNGHWHRVTYTRGCIDTIDSPDDEHEVARKMKRVEINIYRVSQEERT